MSSAPNVYGVSRSIWDDSDFADEPFTEREAWMWLIGKAAWKECRVRGNTGGPVNLRRAEFSLAVRFLAEKWHWGKDKTHRFLKKLEKRDMIRDASRDGSQIYSIKNYNRFQVVGVPKRDADSDDVRDESATAERRQSDKLETGKQGNRETNNSGADAPEGNAATPQGLFPTECPIPGKALIPDWIPAEQWAGYVEMRRKIRAPLTPRAIKLTIDKLVAMRADGEDVGAVLDQSIQQSYRGVFPVKHQTGGHNGAHRHQKPAIASFGASVARAVDQRAERSGLLGGGGAEVIDAPSRGRAQPDLLSDQRLGPDADAA